MHLLAVNNPPTVIPLLMQNGQVLNAFPVPGSGGGGNFWPFDGTAIAASTGQFVLAPDPTTGIYSWHQTIASGVGGDFNFAELFYDSAGGGVVHWQLGYGHGAGTDVAGVEISAFSVMSLATEGADSPIILGPISGGVRGGFTFSGDVPSLYPFMAISAPSTTLPDAAHAGLIRLPSTDAAPGASLPLIAQRDAADATDLPIVQRFVGQLVFGNQFELNNLWASSQTTFQLFAGGGAGWTFQTAVQVFRVSSDNNQKTLYHGAAAGRDGTLTQLYSTDTTENTPIVIAIIDIPDNAVTTVSLQVVAREPVAPDFAGMSIKSTFQKLGGVITPATAPGTPVDDGHSAGAAGTVATLSMTPVGADVQVSVTPWTVADVHWIIEAKLTVNTGTF